MAFDLLGALVTPSPAPAPVASERSLTTDVETLTALPEAASLVPAAFLGSGRKWARASSVWARLQPSSGGIATLTRPKGVLLDTGKYHDWT